MTEGLLSRARAGDQVAALTCFLDTSVLTHFGLPGTLPDYSLSDGADLERI